MKKEQVLARLKEDCLVAVVRAKNLEQGEKVIDAIIEGGINFIEICMTVDEGSPIDLIANMVAKYKDNEKIVIGAGTVLDPETARMAIMAGAYSVGTGSSLTKGAKTGDFAAVTAKAKEFVEAVAAARK